MLEYIVFPTQELLRQSLRAWHWTDSGWIRWQPDADSFLVSRVLGLRFRAEDVLLRVYNNAGRIPTSGELAEIAKQQADALAEQSGALAEKDATLAEKEAALSAERERNAALLAEIDRLRGDGKPPET